MKCARRGKKCAVAAQNDDQVHFLAQRFAGERWKSRVDAAFGFLIYKHFDISSSEPFRERRNNRRHHFLDRFADVYKRQAYAPYVDLLWCETSKPDLAEARKFAEGIHAKFPGKMLAYNCSPSFNWKKNLDDATIAKFQRELASMGYKFQFITLAGFHALNLTDVYKRQP